MSQEHLSETTKLLQPTTLAWSAGDEADTVMLSDVPSVDLILPDS